MTRPPLVLAAATFAVTLLAAPAVQADSVEVNPDAEDDCSVSEQCPETGVSCDEAFDVCWEGEQCPESAVSCDPTALDVETCRAEAVAAGLELRCEESLELYCRPGEKGEAATCHEKARADGLEERCVDRSYETIYCDPGEDESGCSVETLGTATPRRGALAVFLAAVAATAVRAARRRRG